MADVSRKFVAAESDKWRHTVENIVYYLLFAAASVSVLTTLGIVVVLLWETVAFFSYVSLVEFFGGTEWYPSFNPPSFGIWPLVCGTLLVAVCSVTLAVPFGLLGAIYLSEYATPGVRNTVKPLLEILAGIPSVVLGYFAIVLISPALRAIFGEAADFYNAASASVAVAVMILPTVISLSEDVLRSVPLSLREAAYALGSTKFEVTTRVVVPAALSGIMAAVILAISRAIGETMAVALAAGLEPKLTLNPLKSIQTMTAFIVEMSQGDTSVGSPAYLSIFAVCFMLFLMTLSMNVLAQWILSRLQEKYE